MWKLVRRVLISLVLLAGVIGIAIVGRGWFAGDSGSSTHSNTGLQKSMPEMDVQLVSVQRDRVSSSIQLTGNLLPRRRTVVVAEVDGVIESIPRSPQKIELEIDGRQYSENLGLDLGQAVSKDDVLVQLDPTEYQLQLAASQAQLKKAQKELEDLLAWKRPEVIRRLQAVREEAMARLERAQSDFARTESLLKQRATSKQTFESAEAELRSARAALERADADLAEAEAGPTEAEIAVARALVDQAQVDVQIKEDRLRKTVVRAPYDAVIVDRFVDEGERVTSQPRVELMELMDLSLMIVQIGIPERYLGRVEIGQWVEVETAATIRPVPGIVVLVNEKVDHETRTFRVRVAIENHEKIFKAGQFAKVTLKIDSAGEVLVVPNEALVFAGGQPHVFLYEESTGRVKELAVRLGISNGSMTHIEEGLSLGDHVVLVDPTVLADGMKVAPREHKVATAGNRVSQIAQVAGGSR